MVFSTDNCKELIQELPEALFLEDLSGNILQVNHQACRMLGYEEEELLDMEVEDLVSEGAPAFLPERIDEVTRKGKPLKTINVREDGTEIPVELRGRIIEVEGEERILVSIRDITERKQLEDNLKTSEKRYRRLFETAQDGMLILDANSGKIMDANPYIQELLGFSKQDMVGKQLWEIGTFQDVAENKEKFQELVEEGYIRYEHLPLKAKSGEEASVEFVSNTYMVDGQRVVQCNIRDITERKKAEEKLEESEEKYRTIFESAEDAIFIMKGDRFVDCNEKTLEMFECEREDIVGQPPYEFSPEKQPNGRDSAEKAKKKINLALEGDPQNFEWVHTTKDGESFPAEVTLNRYMIEDEKFVMAIVRDITDRKKAEQALDEKRDKLRNLHNAVDELQRQNTEEEILQTAVDVAERTLGFKFCVISLVEGDYLIPKASVTGLDPEESIQFEIGEGISGKSMQKGETIWGEDVREHPDAKPTRGDFRAFMSVPIGELGVFQVVSEEVGTFNDQDVKLAEVLAGHLREELKRVRLEEELRQQAIRDPLTDLYNRRYFNETLGEEVEKSKRYGRPIAFLMADIDRFKEINDRFSHQTGDQVLQEVANLLYENVRKADTVVRYGGDEFLVMMPETNGGVAEVIERLENELSQWNERTSLIDFPLSLAMGVSHWSPEQDRDLEEALKESDKRMYEDKREDG